MSGVELWGWDATNENWVKVLVNSEGKLIIDPSEIFEESPTNNEVGKAPTSNWAYGHENDVPSHSPGEGHITVLPFAYDSIGQGTWAFTSTPNAWSGYFWQNSSHADGDNISYKVYLAAGTYSIRLLARKGNNAPVVDIDIDGAEVASFDLYAGSDQENQLLSDTGNVISTGGLKTLRLRVDGKNGSSSDYCARIGLVILWRTA
jgi:hypothetical protein